MFIRRLDYKLISTAQCIQKCFAGHLPQLSPIYVSRHRAYAQYCMAVKWKWIDKEFDTMDVTVGLSTDFEFVDRPRPTVIIIRVLIFL